MKKLTNKQMEVLSERVTDLLQENHEKEIQTVTNSEEFRNFETEYSDKVVEKLNRIQSTLEAIKKEKQALAQEVDTIARDNDIWHRWQSNDPEILRSKYIDKKKEEKFGNTHFDREKILRKVQADILLSDIENPEELVASLVDKLK